MDEYSSLVDRLRDLRPRLSRSLEAAAQQRTLLLSSLLEGARFSGLNELLTHLDSVVESWQNDAQLQRVAFLVRRAIADFETGVEATLSGYFSVTADAMRDVVEIENLLLDFSIDPGRAEAWLRATQKELRSEFRPAQVRARVRAAIGGSPSAIERGDYNAHSQALHVSPTKILLGAKGFSSEEGFGGDAGFWELFEHGRRIVAAIDRIENSVSGESTASLETLTVFMDGWKRTQEMQEIFLALLRASAESAPDQDELETPR